MSIMKQKEQKDFRRNKLLKTLDIPKRHTSPKKKKEPELENADEPVPVLGGGQGGVDTKKPKKGKKVAYDAKSGGGRSPEDEEDRGDEDFEISQGIPMAMNKRKKKDYNKA